MKKREEILCTAAGHITGNRASIYGPADKDFAMTGKLWEQVLGVPVRAEQVALCMALLKIRRLISASAHEDSWVDACGYLALGAEIAIGYAGRQRTDRRSALDEMTRDSADEIVTLLRRQKGDIDFGQ